VDIALGVSMTPTTVRMVLVEGENADGVTVDHDVFDITSDHTSATAPEQVVAAIVGTRESATEGGHRLVSTGVTWRDHDDAARLREALAAHDIDDVMLVSELHAAGALAQAVGSAVGYQRTALMFLDGDTATLSVVEAVDGSIVRVERQDLHTDDAVARLSSMVAALEDLPAPPQGVFVVGSGVSVAALKSELESATSLPVSAPDEPELALARGAALASVRAPLFEASTVARAYAQDGDEGPTAGSDYAATGIAVAPAALAYSEVDPADESDFPPVPAAADAEVARRERRPFLLVGSAMTGIFVLGVAALVISLAVSIRPTVDQRPSPSESVIVPTQAPAPAAAVPPAPAVPAPPPETIQAPMPVVQEAPQPQAPPRTVFVEKPADPAPAAPAPVAPAPPPAAPLPPLAPAAPPVVAPVVPAPPLPIFRWPWQRQNDYPQYPPQQQWPPQQQNPWNPPPQQNPQQWDPPQSDDPPWKPPKQQKPPSWDPPEQDAPSWNPGKQSGSGSGRGSDDSGGRGSNGGGNSPLWPWGSWGQ
jgi:hypothetical protein